MTTKNKWIEVIIEIIRVVTKSKARFKDLRQITNDHNTSNAIPTFMKKIGMLSLSDDGYVILKDEWRYKSIETIYEAIKQTERNTGKMHKELYKQQKSVQLKLEDHAPVPTINEWLDQLPMEEIIKFVQSKSYIVLSR
jgi:hypothetical protein